MLRTWHAVMELDLGTTSLPTGDVDPAVSYVRTNVHMRPAAAPTLRTRLLAK